MWRSSHLCPPRGRDACLPRLTRSATSWSGVSRHCHLRWHGSAHAQSHGPGCRHFSGKRSGQAARHAGHWPHALFHGGRFRPAQRAANHGESNKGMMALAHNGNLVNAQDIRQRLDSQGSIFQTNSDTEVIVHLIALSKEQTLPEAIADALRQVEGAFSLVMISPDRIFAARDPRGFRPLAMGRIPAQGGEKHDRIVFASETCAFDLIGATFERDVKAGELVIVGPEGVSSRFYSPTLAQSSCI